MDVPATRPEVTTSGIYGEELGLIRQRLLRSELSWCGDLTARTQALVVGRVTPVGSRKLAVARARRLPCVSSSWVTDGACSLDAAHEYDIGHELAGKEVCTTSLSHVERGRVQAVCGARGATYNALLTRMCGLLVAPASAFAFTSPSASSPATANDKIRFARKHGIWIMSLDEFALRYGVEASTRSHHRLSEVGSGVGEGSASAMAMRHEKEQPPALPKGSSGLSGSNRRTRSEVPTEPTANTSGGGDGSSGGQQDVLVSGSVRCTALSVRSASCTPRTSAAMGGYDFGKHVAPIPVGVEEADSWRSSAAMAMSAVQPSLPTQLTAIAATGTFLTPSLRLRGDEFSDVVAYCSPPHRLTTAQHDLLSGMSVAVTPHLTPCTTHVLVLGDGVEECLFPRPGLQIVSWQWVVQSQLEQRRLSCAAFRLPSHFCPVITFTGLCASDKQELVAALLRSRLLCEVQEALVLGGCRGADLQASARPSAVPGSSFLPQSTTHLVSLRRQLLTSQKVAALAQHSQQQQARRRPSSLPNTAPHLSSSPSSTCRLVGVEWVYRSIQQGQWLDPDLFSLAVPHPEAFALAAAAARAAATREGNASTAPPPYRVVAAAPVAPSASSVEGRQFSQPSPTASLASTASATGMASAPLGSSSQLPPPPPPAPASSSVPHSGRSPSRAVVLSVKEGEEEEEDEGGAALSQHRTSGDGDGARRGCATALPIPPVSHTSFAAQRDSNADDEDEEAGGESPSATAARHSALQALHTSQPLPSPAEQPHASLPLSSAPDKRGVSTAAIAATESLTRSLQPTANTAASSSSHLYLGTQFSPTFENLLGELEAYPTGGVVGGAPPFASLGAAVRGLPQPPLQQPSLAALSSPGQVSVALNVQEGESTLYSPPQLVDALVQQGVVLQRASLFRQHIRNQHPPQENALQQRRSFTASRRASDESQVIFYQMGLGDTPVATVPSQANSQCNAEETTIHAGAGHNAADGNVLSTVSSAVFLITKDVFHGDDFDWEVFAAQFPHLRRTSKPEECTHFVTGKPSKTEQFLCCLAAGHWILTPAYLAACAAAGSLVKEDAFEWSAEVASALGCRSSVASLVRGCRLQRIAAELPFAHWHVQVCCSTPARADSFMRVLRNGGCVSLGGVSASELLEMAGAGAGLLRVQSTTEGPKMVLADETVFTIAELERYAQCAAAQRLCPLLRMDYLVQFLCAPETPTTEVDLLHCVQARKRGRTEGSPAH